MCVRAKAMTANTSAMNSSGTPLWNRSLIELTNTRRGFRQCSGTSRRSGHSRRSKPCS